MPTCLNEKDWMDVRGQGVVCENIQNVKIGIDNNFDKKLYIFKNDKE